MRVSGCRKYGIWVRDRFSCIYCGSYLDLANVTIDHVIPLELGGTDRIDNLATSCFQCNSAKSNRGMENGYIRAAVERWRKKNDYPLDLTLLRDLANSKHGVIYPKEVKTNEQ